MWEVGVPFELLLLDGKDPFAWFVCPDWCHCLIAAENHGLRLW
jgi:hypothetical protein